MGSIIYTVRGKDDFQEFSFDNLKLSNERGITLIRGKLKESKETAIQAVAFEDSRWDKIQVNDWIKKNGNLIEMTIQMPDAAANLWLETYDKACVEGKSGDEAAEIAMATVKKLWYQDRNGSWNRFAESFQKAILGSDRPTIEVFRTGKFPQLESDHVRWHRKGGEVTEEDLDRIIENFDQRNIRAPVTNDHRQDGPSLGWVDRLFRQGGKLFATLANLTTEFVKKIKSGEYSERSLELYTDLDFNGQRVGPALKAITFLGVKSPQVKGMARPAFANLFSHFDNKGGGAMISIDNNDRVYEWQLPWAGFPVDVSDRYVRIRIKDPSKFIEKSFRTFIPEGIDPDRGIKAIGGKMPGSDSLVIQAWLFDKEKWSIGQAKAWLKKHGEKAMSELENDQVLFNHLFEKGDNILELSEKELQEKIEQGSKAAVDKAIAEVEVKFANEKKTLTDENESLKKKVSEADSKQLQTDAERCFEDFLNAGKVFPFQKEKFIALFKLYSKNSDSIEFGEKGDKATAREILEGLFKDMPNVVKMQELTKSASGDDNSLDDDVHFDGANEESVELHKKTVALMAEKKWDDKEDPKYAFRYARCYAIVKKGK